MEERLQFKDMIEKIYFQFKYTIINEIQRKNITSNNDENCCLINEDFIKEISKIENYNTNRRAYFFSKKEPNFINYISKRINEKFVIIKKDFLGLIYGDYKNAGEELYNSGYYNNCYNKIYVKVSNAKTFNYIAGYNKLIIVSEKDSSLLILNPIDSIINNNSFVKGIILKYNKEQNYGNELYKKIISSDLDVDNNNRNLNLKMNLIIDESEENYKDDEEISKALENIKIYKKDILFKNNRILIFVNLYFYEKNLRTKEIESAFKKFDEYYLINNEWLKKYKLDNNYEKVCDILTKYEEKNKDIYLDYYLNNYKFIILNDLVTRINLDFLDNLDFNEMNQLEENYNQSFIMHKRIIQFFLNYESIKPANFRPKRIKAKGCYIYIIDKTKLNIGTLNEDLTFNTKYVINFNSYSIHNEETEKLFNIPIEEYLKLRKCNVKVKNEKIPLNLYDDNNNILGTLLIIGGIKEQEKNENSKLIDLENKENPNPTTQQVFEKTISSLKQNQAMLTQLTEKYNEIQKQLNNKGNELDKIMKEKELLEKEVKDKEEELNSLKNGKKFEYSNINKKYKEILDKYNILENENINKGKEIEKIIKEKEIIDDKNKKLEETLKEQNQEKEELKNKYSEIEKKLNEENLLNEDYKNKLKNYEDILEQYQNQINDLDIKYKAKIEEFNVLKNEEKNKDEKNRETENSLSAKEQEILNINNDNLQLKKELQNKEDELLKIKDELTQSSNNLIQLKNEINDLNNKIIEKDTEISKMKQTIEDLDTKNENNNNLLKQYKEELEKAKDENIKKENNLKNVQNTNDNEINNFKKEIEELEKIISDFKIQLTEQKGENEQLVKEIGEKQIKLDENKIVIEKIKSDYKAEQEKVKEMEKKLDDYEQNFKDMKNSINKYESDLKAAQTKNNELNKNLENTIKENEQQINEILNSNINEFNKRENENKELKLGNEKIKSELNELKNLNVELNNKNKELQNLLNLKEKEINDFKNKIKENESQKISEIEFQKILELNDELSEKNKILEKKEKEYLNELDTYKNLVKEFDIKKNEIKEDEQININNMNNDIKQLEQRKSNLNSDIYNLTLKLSELEQKVKEKQLELEKQEQKSNKDKDIIKTEYTFPPNVGLNNIGATCFMNSTLQCLSNTKQLTNYYLNPLYKDKILKNNIALKNPNDLQLSPLYLELISKLWAKDGSNNYSPYNFMNGIQSMNPLFQRGQAGDAKDFIIFILEQMHRELKKNVLKNKIELEPLNQYDKSNAFQHFFADLQSEVSIISDVFFGFNETTNICLDCKKTFSSQGKNYPICYNYGIFNCLIFPLEEVKKMKNKFMQMFGIQGNGGLNSMNNNRVSLIECFVYNQKTDNFTGANQNYCNVCRKMADSDYSSKIYISPNVLVLILNRGKGNIYDVKLDFAENIDITDFVSLRERQRITYNLYGVITHLGESGPYAHFVASCKSPVDNHWYRFNDGLVSPINDFQKEVHDFGNPYILFYQKNDF